MVCNGYQATMPLILRGNEEIRKRESPLAHARTSAWDMVVVSNDGAVILMVHNDDPEVYEAEHRM
jgi:hypothetical protein